MLVVCRAVAVRLPAALLLVARPVYRLTLLLLLLTLTDMYGVTHSSYVIVFPAFTLLLLLHLHELRICIRSTVY